MKIFYLSEDYTTHDHRFLAAASAAGHLIHFLRLEANQTPYEFRDVPAGVRVVPWEPGHRSARTINDLLHLVPRVARAISEVKPDVVHAGPVQSCGFLAALTTECPLLVASWGSDLLVKAHEDAIHQWITKTTLKRADGLLCDCSAVRRVAEEYFDYPGDRIYQFPWGIELHRFAHVRRPVQTEIIVLSMRAWEPGYGIETVIAAFDHAHRSHPSLRLLLLGAGSLEARVVEEIHRRGLVAVVRTPGRVGYHDLPRYLQNANIYLSCAPTDGSSVSLLEAMAARLPVVVTDSPSNREWVEPGNSGSLVAAGDVEGFSSAILHLANAPASERDEIGEHNRSVVSARADWSRHARRLDQAYTRVVQDPLDLDKRRNMCSKASPLS